ncbi:acyl-CoA thioesterase [Pseudoflavonifractor phocaeensis]|uniref:acyl-CoA thioesterase n=1 Tax=Pseudoflavonifractor phocaeensis TaxID=1870988 RepID=UPI001959EC4E|nr:acyl-CoA thioesterase [Pseudoflavonifractor phocaeensis]MBM6927384.1 acyl-CoA thioesterase [Pseudoflavonifractor phocaeensis]
MELKPYLHKVQFYETDGMSIVHHGNYILWMEEARTDFMDQIGWSYHRAVDAQLDFAVTDVSCKYRSMTRFGETVAIHMAVNSLSPAKMELSYKMYNAETGELRAEGTSGHFFYDRVKARPVALKRAIPELWELLVSIQEGRK